MGLTDSLEAGSQGPGPTLQKGHTVADMVGKAGLQPCGRKCTCNALSAAKARKRSGKRREARAWRREAAE